MTTPKNSPHCNAAAELSAWIKAQALALGFAHVGISQPDLRSAKQAHLAWLEAQFQGEMDYMSRNIEARFQPDVLVPHTLSIISVALPYLATDLPDDWRADAWQNINNQNKAYVSRYALGRDYHKVVRNTLQKLASALAAHLANMTEQVLIYRAFADSAPVPEVEIAQQTALGWRGKHTLLLNRAHGSMFFLGELYVNLDLATDAPSSAHCGQCTACIDICPTRAIVAPYRVDARRCISYLTIEHKGEIPHEFRQAIGNRIYGCDDCQLVCPWNKFAQKSALSDFAVRHALDCSDLLALLQWDEATFKHNMAGSAAYRIGHAQWQRNVLLALGNAPTTPDVLTALQTFTTHHNPVVAEQARWSLAQHPK
ncbi:tRNA epoxyqueuosine(34) reductase QueG [Hydromonas duriensis]|uniref:Epoxyqueuosine reductase n=1 Tax=Hydromonas duriensis TaxID=1527608 RepID=A0A4R6Y7G1_9BURK|nr:tRNA epoxyqueuosine(34) reductase QueG [Hydromonas duriensis]TDR31270.1 epoxyqueuosine reductase [Hydromonas duriensis]